MHIKEYYRSCCSQESTDQPVVLSDRVLETWNEFSIADSHNDSMGNRLDVSSISGNCTVRNVGNYIEAAFHGGEGSYQFLFNLQQPQISNGVSVRFRLRGWESLRYVGVGYTCEKAFRHVKITNAARDHWIDFSIGHGDIAFGLQNDWAHPPATELRDIRLYFKGTPGNDGAALDVEKLWCWKESDSKADEWYSSRLDAGTCTAGVMALTPVQPELQNVVYGYLKKCFRFAEVQAKMFLAEGNCPLYGETSLKWPSEQALPSDLATVGTYQFSWHALHPATILMVYSRESGELAPLFAAREFLTNWLDRSYYHPDPNKKFAWYDHGTAERLIAMLLMWAIGVERGFDRRFMTRLRSAIFRHGQLLESELFYASHQPTRYHNHAWFQDLALMATALALPTLPCAQRWLDIAINRLTDQLDTLIVRDNGFAVFVENSIGYHQGVQRLVEFAGELVKITGKDSVIPAIAQELPKFSDFLRYPDNRAPAQGDTFRRSNASGDEIRRLKPYAEPACTLLPEAGYAVVKGNHNGCRYMLTVLATSLCRTHKHEDNLSFTLFFDGLEWLVDPSFYSHEYASPLPAYLRSAVAHNALALPGLAYSIDPGMAQLDGKTQGGEFVIQGSHRAYNDVLIERKIHGRVDLLELDFVDSATANLRIIPDCNLKLMLHCGEKVVAEIENTILKLTHCDSDYILQITLPNDRAKIYYDEHQSEVIRGVTGLGFMEQAPINTIECDIPFNVEVNWKIKAEIKNIPD